MTSYLIYHPKRQRTDIDGLAIYHDNFGGNEDPYLWNKQFLHTYCHITQLRNIKGQINFWVSANNYPKFEQLFCDCVFVISEKHFWENANLIEVQDKLVENEQIFDHHYKWVNHPYCQHLFKRRRRYTLKADPDKSFQPQNMDRNLVDILPFLNKNGYTTQRLISQITSKYGSRPFKLENNFGQQLYNYLADTSIIKLKGHQIENKHP